MSDQDGHPRYQAGDRRTRFKTLLGQEKNLSVTLYDQILGLPNAEFLAERILFRFSDERGARKRTYPTASRSSTPRSLR